MTLKEIVVGKGEVEIPTSFVVNNPIGFYFWVYTIEIFYSLSANKSIELDFLPGGIEVLFIPTLNYATRNRASSRAALLEDLMIASRRKTA